MSSVLVFVDTLTAARLGPGEQFTATTSLDEWLAALRADPTRGYIVWAGAVPMSRVAEVVQTVAGRSSRCIEVRAERWDGHSPSPLSAACRGVISGFGLNGIHAAVKLLSNH